MSTAVEREKTAQETIQRKELDKLSALEKIALAKELLKLANAELKK